MKSALRQSCLLAVSGLGAVWVFIYAMRFGDDLRASYDPRAHVETWAFINLIDHTSKVFAVAIALRALLLWRVTYLLFLLAAGVLVSSYYSRGDWCPYFLEFTFGIMISLGFVLTAVFISDYRELGKERANLERPNQPQNV